MFVRARSRQGWAALVAGSLVALGGCSKSEEGKTSPSPSAEASQAQAAQSAIASAEAAHAEHVHILGQPLPMNATGGLPPARGAPHLYHLGIETFFLKQGSAIGLTPEQQGKLSKIKEKADLAYAATQRKIDEAENDVWTLTSAERPDVTTIDAKISEIGRLGGQQRMDYVRAVGSAVAVLNEAQRKAVIALDQAAK